jgi:NAD(P)-dependent dehydrogenase (short-subunit alcohol dehydrogenase family)
VSALFDLDGRVALVTGGNSGIGLGMADGLAAAGAAVAICGTKPDKNERALERLRSHHGAVAAWICDVGDEEEVDALVTAVVERFGRLDACFANAGVSASGIPFVDTSLEVWQRVLRVNLDGTFLTLRAAARQMLDQGDGGRLIATSSTSTIMGQARGQPYAASKGGVEAMIKAIAVELGRHGITANALVPGWIESDLTHDTLRWDRFVERVLPRVPVGRWGEGEDVAGLAVYLASEASRFHTGDSFVIDGGYTLF